MENCRKTFVEGLKELQRETDARSVVNLRQRIDEAKTAKNYRRAGDLVALLTRIQRQRPSF